MADYWFPVNRRTLMDLVQSYLRFGNKKKHSRMTGLARIGALSSSLGIVMFCDTPKGNPSQRPELLGCIQRT